MTLRPKVPFFRPAIGEDEIDEVVAVLRSGWLTTGERVARLEADLVAFLGGEVEAVAVNSATAGLHLALEALGIGPGDEVIVPDLTFTATAEVARYLGAEVRLVDVDPQTLCLDIEAVAAAIGPRTRAVIPVHYGGLACELERLLALTARYDIAVVEDAAHALPTRHAGRLVGTHASDATVFSFYANKPITTGEGGMLVTRRKDLAARARVMRLHGIDRDAFFRFRDGGASWQYDIVAPGFKYNLSDMAAAVGIHQLARVTEMRDRRAAIAARYLEAFAELPVHLPDPGTGDEHAWHLFALRVRPQAPIDRNGLADALTAARIGFSVHYVPLHRMTYWRERYRLCAEDFPVSERAFHSLLTLPIFPDMREDELGFVIDVVRAALTGAAQPVSAAGG